MKKKKKGKTKVVANGLGATSGSGWGSAVFSAMANSEESRKQDFADDPVSEATEVFAASHTPVAVDVPAVVDLSPQPPTAFGLFGRTSSTFGSFSSSP